MAASTEAPAFAPTSLPLSNAYASRDLPVCPSPTSSGSSPSQLTFPISPLDPRLFSIDGPHLQTPNPSSWPKPRLVTGGHRDPVQCVAWNSEGKKLVSSSSGAQGVRVWDVGSNGASFSASHSLALGAAHKQGCPISKVEWNPVYVSELVTAGSKADAVVCFWDVRASAKEPTSSLPLSSPAFQLAHHPEGRTLALSDLRERIHLFDYRMLTAEPVASMEVDGEPVVSPAKESKPEWVSSERWKFPNATDKPPVVYDIGFSASGKHILWCTNSGKIHVRPVASLEVVNGKAPEPGQPVLGEVEWRAQTAACEAIAVEGEGKYIASGGADGIVNIWSTTDWIPEASFEDMTGEIKHLEFSRDGELLAAGGDESAIYIFSTAAHSLVHKISTGAGAAVSALAWSPKHDVLAYATGAQTSSGAFSVLSAYA